MGYIIIVAAASYPYQKTVYLYTNVCSTLSFIHLKLIDNWEFVRNVYEQHFQSSSKTIGEK